MYSESKIQALENLSFTINNKESLGLIGVTGSGKTTLLKLITRSFNLDSGKILIDDKNINEFNVESLRKQIGVVSQDSFLFSDSIINNIRFGNEKASIKEIKQICKIAGITKK